MNKINWKVRVKNVNFWVALIPAILLVIQQVAGIFGFALDLGDVGDKLMSLAYSIFAVLAIIGVVNDPTTKGISDSSRALTYDRPKEY